MNELRVLNDINGEIHKKSLKKERLVCNSANINNKQINIYNLCVGSNHDT